MYLAYLDDSKSAQGKHYQIVGGVLVADSLNLDHLEDVFAFIRELEAPKEFDPYREFHTSDLLNGRGKFEGVERPRALEIIRRCARLIGARGYPVFYGAVDVDRHKSGIFSSAHPITVGFRMCLDGIQSWMERYSPEEMCMVVFDNFSDRAPERRGLQLAFREGRTPLDTMEGSKGKWRNLVDDLCFGDSEFSVGIQAADLCALLIK